MHTDKHLQGFKSTLLKSRSGYLESGIYPKAAICICVYQRSSAAKIEL